MVVVVIVGNRSENICFCARMSLSVWNHDIDTKGETERARHSDTRGDEEGENKPTEICVPDHWMY